MDKISFLNGYMSKRASVGGIWEELIQGPGYKVVLPSFAAYTAGRLAGGVMEPPQEAVNQLQAEYVKVKMAQAVEDLERKRKRERMKQEHARSASSLRI